MQGQFFSNSPLLNYQQGLFGSDVIRTDVNDP